MGASNRELARHFEAELKSCRPRPTTIVACNDETGKESPISKPPGAARWKTVARLCVDMLSGGTFDRVELRGADKGVLRVLRAEDLDDDAEKTSGDGMSLSLKIPKELGGGIENSETLKALAYGLTAGMRVSDHAVERLAKIMGPVLTANTEVIKTLSGRLSQLEGSYGRLLQAQEAALLAQVRAEKASGGDGAMTETDREALSLLKYLAERKMGDGKSNGHASNEHAKSDDVDDRDMPPEPPE